MVVKSLVEREDTNIFEKIRQYYEKLTEAQKKVADYLINNIETAAFLSAARLGKESGVSESVVIRFANAIGYFGYPEMQRAIQQVVMDKLSPANKAMSLYEKKEKKDTVSILYETIEQDINNLKETLNSTSPETFTEVVKTLSNSRKIFIVGQRALNSLARLLGFMLQHIFSEVIVMGSLENEMFENLKDLTEEDVLIALSFPRYTRRTIEAIDYANSCGAKTIAITDKIVSPAAQKANLLLIAKSNMASFHNSYVALLSMINAIICSLTFDNSAHVLASLEKMEKVLQKYEFWNRENFKK